LAGTGQKHWDLLAGVACFTLLGGFLVRCAGGSAPPPPSPVATSADTTRDSSSSDGSSDGSSSGGSDGQLGGSSDGSGGTTDTGSGTSSDSGTGTTVNRPYVYGGAPLGSDTDQAAMNKCLDQGMFYDRFANGGSGTCTQLALAKVDCTQSGIDAVLSANDKTSFDGLISGSYSGWSFDQCLDCAPGASSAQCTSTAGAAQTGTKIFFVQQSGSTINGKSIVVPERPKQ
jgi:hypothetical protein